MSLENGIKQTIQGETLDECKQKLYELYGNDYTIEKRESKFKPYGFLGLKQKEIQVITYSVNHHRAYENSNLNNYSYSDRQAEIEQLEKNQKAILENKNNILLNSQIAQISSQIEQMSKQLNKVNDNISSAGNEQHETITKIQEMLSQNEFSFSYIKMIEDKIRSTFSLEQLNDFKLVERYVVDWIGETIEISKRKVFRPPHVVIIVGPTGVGKTTTIAKLAATTIIDAKNRNVTKPELCLITIDSMRVGALEQIKTFGDILQKNVFKAESVDDLKSIYEDYKDHTDYMFIDTSGYSPNDVTKISEMKAKLDVNMNADVYLAVSASTKASDLTNIFRNYEPFAYESIIITKFDESKVYGNIISVLWERHKSISYITDGQGVPRNIREADIVDILKNLSGFDIDRVHIEDKFHKGD